MSDLRDITIRPPESTADYRALREAQRQAWGGLDAEYLVPVATLVGAHRHGGLVLGAFRVDGVAVGISFGFLGKVDGRLALYSQLTGIVPEYRGEGLGTRIKLAQRDYAIREGLSLIAWAFDPLQAGNARFNLRKLGATVRAYLPDLYGNRTDPLNRLTPTDRVIALWETNPQPRERPDPSAISRLPRLLEGGCEPADPPRYDPDRLRESDILLEIPVQVGRLRRESPEAALSWQSAVRSAMLAAFASGFSATGWVEPEESGGRFPAYLLAKPVAPG